MVEYLAPFGLEMEDWVLVSIRTPIVGDLLKIQSNGLVLAIPSVPGPGCVTAKTVTNVHYTFTEESLNAGCIPGVLYKQISKAGSLL